MVLNSIIVDVDIRLIKPDPKKDALVTVKWLEGVGGQETLRYMGILVDDNFKPDVKSEVKRLKTMAKSKNEYISMIEHKGVIVGTVEIWTVQYDGVPAPSISIMIGSPHTRGHNIGSQVIQATLAIIKNLGYDTAYSRALLSNSSSCGFFAKNGFEKTGLVYDDIEGLIWQNYSKNLIEIAPRQKVGQLS